MRETLGSLNERQRQVLELRFGLVDGVYHSLESVSKIIGLTRERVRQMKLRRCGACATHPAATHCRILLIIIRHTDRTTHELFCKQL